MRGSWLLRYVRLLTWYTEARLSYLLSHTLAETIRLVWIGLAVFVGLLCLSAALVLAIKPLIGPPLALLLAGFFWLLVASASVFFLGPYLHKRFQAGRHLYRMTLARAGLRLLEKNLTAPPAAAAPGFLGLLGSFLSRWLSRWLMRKFQQFLRKMIPL
jgi:hypothetical protein